MTTCSHDLDASWRPRGTGREPICGYTFRGKTCKKRGPHYCEPRADKAVKFFARMLVHTKGAHKRRPFILKDWQEWDIVRPLFGEVAWSTEWGLYVRRYRVFYFFVARKNGKSEFDAGLVLLLLVGDDEEAAEVFGAAADTKQAGKVFEPALRMRDLSPKLKARLQYNKNSRRLFDESTASYYEIITADPLGELGHGPHGFVLDEVLSQRNGDLWEAMRTALGTRTQPLLIATSTETNDPHSFGADMIDEAEAIMYDPARAPHILSYVRKLPSTDEKLEELQRHFAGHPDLPVSTDHFDERNWKWPNPGLDDFKSREAMREMALEAKNEPRKENSFRQFQLNQRVAQATRWMPMQLYHACSGDIWLSRDAHRENFRGRTAYCGLDLAAKFDLVAWCIVIPDEESGADVFWRFWLPEDALPELDKATNGRFTQWAQDGWLTLCEGGVIEYDDVYRDIGEDANFYNIAGGGADKWSLMPVIQEVSKRTSLEVDKALVIVEPTYQGMSPGMGHLMSLVKTGGFRHHGNPVAEFCFDCVETRHAPYDPELIRPDKPDRQKTGKRIDGVTAGVMAVDAWKGRGVRVVRSAYEEHDLIVI